MHTLYQLKVGGDIGAIGLSEVNAETIRFAHEFLQQLSAGEFGLSAVQMEYSLLTRDIEKNGVLAICKQLGISVVAYSPISRGLLSGKLQDLNSLAEDDSRRHLPRFMGNNLQDNNNIVAEITAFAQRLGITPAQLALAWVMNNEVGVIPIPGTRTAHYLDDNIKAADITFSREQLAELEGILSGYKIAGSRYPEEFMPSNLTS